MSGLAEKRDVIMDAAWALIWLRIGELDRDIAVAAVDRALGRGAYLIEERDQGRRWWAGIQGWTSDPEIAVRFARREDAERASAAQGWSHVIVTEHSWDMEIVR